MQKLPIERLRNVGEKSHTSSWGEPECVQTSSKTLKGSSEIGCESKFWRVFQPLQRAAMRVDPRPPLDWSKGLSIHHGLKKTNSYI